MSGIRRFNTKPLSIYHTPYFGKSVENKINGIAILGNAKDAVYFFTFRQIPACLLRIRSIPFVWQLLDGSRFGHGLQGLQRIQNDASLAFDIARFAEHTAARKFDQQGPGRLDVRHSIAGIAHRNSGNSRFLDQALNQTHGLMAFRSDRHQK